MKCLSDAEHTVLPALLLLPRAKRLLQYRLTANLKPSHLPSFLPSFLSFRSLDDELPHARRSRSPTRHYDAVRGRRHEDEYLDDR